MSVSRSSRFLLCILSCVVLSVGCTIIAQPDRSKIDNNTGDDDDDDDGAAGNTGTAGSAMTSDSEN